jgi:hypothetical protein
MTDLKRVASGLVLAMVALSATVPVFAAVRLSATRTIIFTFVGSALVPLNNAGATSLTFNGQGVHQINYSAECSRNGGVLDFLTIDIRVDGVTLSPTGDDDEFCSGDASGDINVSAVHHYTVVTPPLATGAHTIQIVATVDPTPGNFPVGRLDDMSLSVIR